MNNEEEAVERGHNFCPQSYGVTPTTCFVCTEFLNGFWQQGYQCSNCSINVHDVCRPQTEKTCFVTHRFKETSYISLPLCAACGQPMLGLWKQGFQCEDCGLDVHATCRTQSSISACKKHHHPPPVVSIEKRASFSLKTSEHVEEKKRMFQRSGSVSGSNTQLAHTQAQMDLPTDLESVIREMKRLHEEILSSNRALEKEWESVTKPSLKAQRTQLEQAVNHSKQKLKDRQKELKQLSQQRDEYFRTFLKAFYTKYNASKAKNVDQLVSSYGNGSQREFELYAELVQKYQKEPTAVAMIEHERNFGPLAMAQQFLPDCLLECERLRTELSKLKKALTQVSRDVFFSPNLPWAVKVGAEGMYAGFTSLWLEKGRGKCTIDCSLHKNDNQTYSPRLTLNLTSFSGEAGKGFVTSARLENLCVFGSALPISLSVRDADVSVDFDLSIQVQYDNDSDGDKLGSWHVVDGGFKLKMFQFKLATRGALSALSIPDVVLGALIQSFITLAFKKLVVLLLPPEFGVYMNAVHVHRDMVGRPPKEHKDVWGENGDQERFLNLECIVDIKQIVELDMVDANLSSLDKLDHGLPFRVLSEVLLLEPDQMKLFLQTQRELGLTFGQLFPQLVTSSDSWFSSSNNNAERGNRLAMESLEDMVRYLRDYLDPQNLSSGMKQSRRLYSCERLGRLWKIALELVCSQLGGEALQHEGSVMGKMIKRIAKTGKSHNNKHNVKWFDFDVFRTQVSKVAQKEIYITVDIPKFAIAVALRGLVRVGRDIALRVLRMLGAKSKKEAVVGSGIDKKTSKPLSQNNVGESIATAISQDRHVETKKANLLPDFGKTLPVQIERGSDFLMDQLKIIQERYMSTFDATIGLRAGEGTFKAHAADVRVCAPVDLSLSVAAPLLGKILSKTVKPEGHVPDKVWLWNRKVEANEGQFKVTINRASTYKKEKAYAGSMVDALRKMGGKAAQLADNTDSTGEFTLSASGFFAQFRVEDLHTHHHQHQEEASILSMSLRPLQDPNRVEVKALGTRAMRVYANVDLVEGKGQFATLFHYVDDFLESLGPKDSKMMRTVRLFPKFVASFAARDSFLIDVAAHVGLKGEASAGDLVVHTQNVENQHVVTLRLTHNLTDLLRDIVDLIEGATKMSISSSKDDSDVTS